MKYVFATSLLIVLLTAGTCSALEAQDETMHISLLDPPVKYDNVVETVIIDNIRYEVPQPWTGNRLFPTARNLDELRQVPTEYTVDGSEIYLLAEAFEPFRSMLAQARTDGIELLAESAYRSIHYQVRIFVRRMKKGHSFEEVCRSVAPPGYSEHMLGTAIDFHPSDWRFAETPQYQWLKDNAGRFGFEETYSRTNPYNIAWESWHWKYAGEGDDYPAVASAPSEQTADDLAGRRAAEISGKGKEAAQE